MSKLRFRLVMLIVFALTGISIGHHILVILGYVSYNSFPLPDVLMAIASTALATLAPGIKKLLDSKLHEQLPQNPAAHKPHLSMDLLKLTGATEEEQENITGDLLEEFNRFDSRLIAYIWLYKQVLKSVLPLAYNAARRRLASLFDVRAR